MALLLNKRRNQVCFLSFIFPSNSLFLKNFFSSLELQDYQDFDIVLINDGFNNIENFIPSKIKNRVYIFEGNGSIPKIRQIGINLVLELGYKYVVFGDSDDFFQANRISESLKGLSRTHVCFNDLSIFKDEKILDKYYWRKRLIGVGLLTKNWLFDKNCIGLGNSAVRSEVLLNIEIPENIIAVDWFLFSIILQKFNAKFLKNTLTFYRQHTNNLVGGVNCIDEMLVLQAIEVKKNHYSNFTQIPDYILKNFETNISYLSSQTIFKHYLNELNELDYNLFWWESTNFFNKINQKNQKNEQN